MYIIHGLIWVRWPEIKSKGSVPMTYPKECRHLLYEAYIPRHGMRERGGGGETEKKEKENSLPSDCAIRCSGVRLNIHRRTYVCVCRGCGGWHDRPERVSTVEGRRTKDEGRRKREEGRGTSAGFSGAGESPQQVWECRTPCGAEAWPPPKSPEDGGFHVAFVYFLSFPLTRRLVYLRQEYHL